MVQVNCMLDIRSWTMIMVQERLGIVREIVGVTNVIDVVLQLSSKRRWIDVIMILPIPRLMSVRVVESCDLGELCLAIPESISWLRVASS